MALVGSLALSVVADHHTGKPAIHEIGPENKDLLPKGKEADGIVGDFVLENDRISALISGNLPFRKANMGTFWGEDNWTPGCLYDLLLKGSDNDQLTIFSPTGQRGKVSYVRMADIDDDAAAAIETVITSANNNGIFERHLYILKNGWDGILIESTCINESDADSTVRISDEWTRFRSTGTFHGIQWADSIDPSHKAGYAYALVDWNGSDMPAGAEKKLSPGEKIRFARFVSVGTSPASALGKVAEWTHETGRFHGRIHGPAGDGIASAVMEFRAGDQSVRAYPDKDGHFDISLPKGLHTVSVTDIGRSPVADFEFNLSNEFRMDFEMSAATLAVFDITDADGASIPCKAMFKGLDGTPNPDLGPTDRAHGCVDQYHSENGQFTVALNPGKYEISVVHGIEFSSIRRVVELQSGKAVKIQGSLQRIVDTAGWVSADYHNHSTPSGDNTCGTDDRIINLAAEHIEFAPTTEHNRIYNWAPHIQRLGLARHMKTVVGMELTGSGTHFNSFPLEEVPYAQDGGAPRWNQDPRITAATLENHNGYRSDRWIHINHPDMIFNFTDRDGDGRSDGGFIGLGQLVDAIETQNYRTSYILENSPYRIIEGSGTTPFERARGARFEINREFVWLQLLNQGFPVWGIAVADAHHVHGNGVGGWRTYIKSSTDNPPDIQWDEMSRNSKAGRMILTTGPYLEVSTDDGTTAGGYTRGVNGVQLHVRVQCTDWVDIDRVQILINGRQAPEYNYTRKNNPSMFFDGIVKFDEKLDIQIDEDSHIIAVAYGGDFNLEGGFGTSSQAQIKPCAYNNPIFVDIDGGGFKPSGDNLGFSLPTNGMTIEQVRALISSR